MSPAILHGFEGNIEHSLRRREIGVTDLQTDDLAPAGFERQDAIGHGNRG